MRSDVIRRLFFAVCLLASAVPAMANDLHVGEPAPPLTLHTLDGRDLSIADLRGKVVILHFWATWCVPCRVEMPLFSAYRTRHAAEGVEVLGFSLDTPGTLPEVRRVAATLNFPVGLLGSAWAGGYGRIWRLPVSFIIDRDGVLRHDGWDDDQELWTEEKLDRVVTPLLAATN